MVDVDGSGSQAFAGPAPPAVDEFFGPYRDPLVRYAAWLGGPGIERGLIGPRERTRIWDRHVLNSLALSELLPEGVRLVDVGSGAGLPGLALACVRPDLHIDLLEPLQRRTTFLSEVVADLGLAGSVRVVRGRAEDTVIRRGLDGADYATARAVADLAKLTRWSVPMLRHGGELLAIKGRSVTEEIGRDRAAVEAAGADIVNVVDCGGGFVSPAVTVVRIKRR